MKLERCIIQNNAISDLDLLKMENEFLRDELKFQETEQSIELIQTIIHCIKEEKEVSSSLEIMFGENWKDKNTALTELEFTLEGFLKDTFNAAANAAKTKSVSMLINKRLDTLEEILKKKDPQEKVELDVYFHGFLDVMKHSIEKLRNLGELFKSNKKEEACEFFVKIMNDFNSAKLKEEIQKQGGSLSTSVSGSELLEFIKKARQDISAPFFDKLDSEKESVIEFVRENGDLVKRYNISEGTVNRVYDTFVRVILMGWSRMIQKTIAALKESDATSSEEALNEEDLKRLKIKISETKKLNPVVKKIIETNESDLVALPAKSRFKIVIPTYYLGTSETDKEYQFATVDALLYALTLASTIRGGGFLGTGNEIRLGTETKEHIDKLKTIVSDPKYIHIYYPFEDENFAIMYKQASDHFKRLQTMINHVWELYYDHFDKEKARDIAYFVKLRTVLYSMAETGKYFCDQSEQLVEFINENKSEN